MRQVVLVAGHFPPSNLVNVHRARLWAQHLAEFGWKPTIVTTHHAYYEERLDWDLCNLLDADLEVIRTAAIPTRPLRIVGDIGIRGLPFHFAALRRLAASGRIDFLHITIPSNYSALLGRMLRRAHGVPYGIDYNDPWVHAFPGSDQPFTKAWGSAQLARVLEPWAVRDASLITGVARAYYEDMLQRNPQVRKHAVLAAMPFGVSEHDYAALDVAPGRPFLFEPADGRFHMVYAGAMLPKAYSLLEVLLDGIRLLNEHDPELGDRLHLHFVGTGAPAQDRATPILGPYIKRAGVARWVSEHPTRIPYLDVLRHLRAASGNLILGSTEPHYTPSKAFQVVRAGRPAFSILHEQSTAAELLMRVGAGTLVSFGSGEVPSARRIADKLSEFLSLARNWQAPTDLAAFEELTARHSTRLLAEALNRAVENRD